MTALNLAELGGGWILQLWWRISAIDLKFESTAALPDRINRTARRAASAHTCSGGSAPRRKKTTKTQ